MLVKIKYGPVHIFTGFPEWLFGYKPDAGDAAVFDSTAGPSDSGIKCLCRTFQLLEQFKSHLSFDHAPSGDQDDACAKDQYLLRDAVAPVGNIAAELGFSGPGSFSSFFRGQTGITPSEFRKGYQ